MLGVLAASLEKGLEIEKALQLAAAAACAKVKSAPGQFPNRKEALSYLEQVFVEDLSQNNAGEETSENEIFTIEDETVISEK